MKTRLLLGVAALLLLAGVSTAWSLDADFSGEFYVEGILNSSENMLETDKTSDYRQMRLRVRTEFTVSEDLSLITRFDALEKVLSSKDSAFENEDEPGFDEDVDDDNIDFDRAYLSYKSPIGLIQVGRMEGVTWGTPFVNDEQDTDRIKYVLPLPLGEGKLYTGAVFEKVTENDKGTEVSDLDNDKYYIFGVYRAQKYHTGLLCGYYDFNRAPDMGQAFAVSDLENSYDANQYASDYKDFLSANDMEDSLSNYSAWYGANAVSAMTAQGYADAAAAAYAAGDAAAYAQYAALAADAAAQINEDWPNDMEVDSILTLSERGATTSAKAILLAPYFKGQFGDFGVSTELNWAFGTAEYKDYDNVADRDIDAFAFNFEGTYNWGGFTFQGGFAYFTGDADYNDDDIGAMGYLGPGVDWAKMFILDSDDHGMNTTLGNGVGNHVGNGAFTASTAMCDGYQMFYLGADYAVTDSLSLGLLGAVSKADEVPDGPGYDDDQGMEVDVTLTWNITDNLTYSAIGAYLDGGDYWTTRASGGVEDPNVDPDIYALYHKLTLTF